MLVTFWKENNSFLKRMYAKLTIIHQSKMQLRYVFS